MRPLEGVRIADLTWLLAGAGGPRFMAALGAEVIRIEWKGRLDFLRVYAPLAPYRLPEHAELDDKSVNRAGYFNDINPGKRSISLNMAHPKGRELFKRLVGISDLVVESFTAETMHKWELGYDGLKAIKPDIIYVQQPGWGYKGPYVKYASFGPISQGVSGLTAQSGLPEPYPPAGWGFSYMDWSGAYYCAISMLLALYYKKRTGKGQYIDGSQTEPAIYMTGTAVLDYSANGRHYRRVGNRAPSYRPAAPHGVYRCAGEDRWIAIDVTSHEEWRALARGMGNPGWTENEKFRTVAARMENQDEVDRLIEAWSRNQEPYSVQDRLQKAGVAAGVCQTNEDRVDHDPQLRHLNWLIPLNQNEIGPWPIKNVPFHFTNTQVDQGGLVGRASPCYGEDNDYVYGDLLKLTRKERQELQRDGII